MLLKQNVHPKIVQEILGHSSIGITMDTYSHVSPDMQKEAAKKDRKYYKIILMFANLKFRHKNRG